MPTAPEEEPQTYSLFASSFAEVYSADSYDLASDTFNQESIDEIRPYVNHYRHHPLILFTAFFGVPNQFNANKSITGNRIFWNLFDWQTGKSNRRRLINTGLGALMFIKNVFLMGVMTIQNSFKLFTEFLPLLMAKGLWKLTWITFKNCQQGIKDNWQSENGKTLKIAGYSLAMLSLTLTFAAVILLKIIQLIGRTITSPVNSVRIAWFYCVNQDKTPGKFGGRLFGALLAILSISISAMTWSLLCPFVLATAPTSIASILTGIMNAAPAFFTLIGSNLMLPLLAQSGLALSQLSAIMAGFATFFALLTTIAGPVVNMAFDWGRWQWRTTDNRVYLTKREEQDRADLLDDKKTHTNIHHLLQQSGQQAKKANHQLNEAVRNVSRQIEKGDKKARKEARVEEDKAKKVVRFEENKKRIKSQTREGLYKAGKQIDRKIKETDERMKKKRG